MTSRMQAVRGRALPDQCGGGVNLTLKFKSYSKSSSYWETFQRGYLLSVEFLLS